MSNLELYNKAFTSTFGVDESVLNEEFAFAKVSQWDSVAHLSLVSELEDQFDIYLESEDILHFESYQNGIKILKKYGVEM